MSKQSDRLNDYPLFYEDLSSLQTERVNQRTASEKNDRTGLSEDQIAKLSEDLRKPIRDGSGKSNPIQ